ncbi:MAG: SMC family ATPase [Bacteroidetes bacterium]|nr:SMC family ATPase [Bacteroidota bacterium]
MKILKLKLRGAIGIHKGLGVDEIEIDFTQFKPGLIALTGKNGSGKTTIMENLHPFRTMVSRSGSLQSHFYLKDSYRILEFEHAGDIYESRILIDALTNGSEAYLNMYQKNGNNMVPLNDGKLTTYDEEIENVLGSPELFFNSVFSGQKSKGIAELKPADRRKLFYELLNLNVYEQYLEQTKSKLKASEIQLAEIEGKIKSIDISLDKWNEMETARVEALNQQAKLISEISRCETEIDKTNSSIRKLEIEISKSEDAIKRNAEIRKQINDKEERIESLTTAHNSKITRYNSEIEDSNKLILKNKSLAESKVEIENNIELIRKNIDKLNEKSKIKIDLQSKLSELQNNYSAGLKLFEPKQKNLTALRQDKIKAEAELKSVQHAIDSYKGSVKLIDNVPCDSETGTNCQFLKKAYEEKQALPELIKKLQDVNNQVSVITNSISELDAELCGEMEEFELTYQNEVAKVNSKLLTVDIEIEGLAIDKSPNIEKLQKALTEANDAENQIALYQQKIESTTNTVREAVETFDIELSRLRSEIDQLNKQLVDENFEHLDFELTNCKDELKILLESKSVKTNEMDQYGKIIATIEVEQKQFQDNEKKVAELTSQKQHFEKEITDWTFLCKAFDKTGIPVLKLENSGVEITMIANDLLSLFENKFRIVFETTSLTKDKKKLKETFDINIVEEDGVCEISNKSGGQQVWLETAIQLAISQVSRQQGKNIETGFLDEKDGALDLNNAYAYIEMIRKAHEMSGVHNTFVITHRSELLDFIPQQVKLVDGYLELIN